jgi:hypothetical protein
MVCGKSNAVLNLQLIPARCARVGVITARVAPVATGLTNRLIGSQLVRKSSQNKPAKTCQFTCVLVSFGLLWPYQIKKEQGQPRLARK